MWRRLAATRRHARRHSRRRTSRLPEGRFLTASGHALWGERCDKPTMNPPRQWRQQQIWKWEHTGGDSCTTQLLTFRSIGAWRRTFNSNLSTIGCHKPGADGHSGGHLHLIASPLHTRGRNCSNRTENCRTCTSVAKHWIHQGTRRRNTRIPSQSENAHRANPEHQQSYSLGNVCSQT